jgi:hypothetical protein
MKGYKAFSASLTGLEDEYEFKFGDEYQDDQYGFHFCVYPLDVLLYFPEHTARYAIVEATGSIVHDAYKSKCSKIKLVKEISRKDLDTLMPEYVKRLDGTEEWS